MRWLALLLTSTTCFAGYGGPLPEIKVGTSHREMVIHGATWYSGSLSDSRAFLVGTVTDVTAEVQTKPQQTWLAESCTLRVQAAFGHLQQLAGIEFAKLQAGYENSPYVPIDEDWGKLRHLKQGQQVLVLLHLHEGEPCFGVETLMVLHEDIHLLPDILRRTALLSTEFTTDDLMVLQRASPFLYKQALAETTLEREMYAEESKLRRESLKLLTGMAGLGALGVFVIYKVLRKRATAP